MEKIEQLGKDKKEVHYGGGKSYYLILNSELLPFVGKTKSFSEMERSNEILQKFIRFIEKKFDSIWYIGTDYLDNDLYERFMFQHGGFMEISLKGEIRCYFAEDKSAKMRKSIFYAIEKLSSKASAQHITKSILSGQRLISLDYSLGLSKKGEKG